MKAKNIAEHKLEHRLLGVDKQIKSALYRGSGGIADHALLHHLDYVSSGHTGFEPTIGFTPENVANKSTDVALGASDILYPSQNAVKTYVDTAVGVENLWDRTGTTLSPHTANDSVDLGSGNFKTTGAVLIGTGASTGKLNVIFSATGDRPVLERNGLPNNVTYGILRLLATKATDMADGFGPILGFSIQDDAAAVNNIAFIGAARDTSDVAGVLVFRTVDISAVERERMRITSAGNIGIGTTAPDRKLEINVGAATGGMRLTYNDSDGSATIYSDFLIDSGGDLAVTATGGDINFDNENLLTTGSIGVTGSRVLKGWFTDLEVTNAIAGSITGNAATVTVAAEVADISCSVLFATDVSGSLVPKTNTNLTFNASTGVFTSASAVLTTADINGGTVDGASIGASSASTIIGTTIQANTGFVPDADDGAYLGTTALGFSDLFLATGAVINYANGNAVLTHTSGILTLGTGTLKITTPTNTATSVVTIDGTQTLTNKTLTSPNINEAVALTTTATKLNYLTSATGTTGTTSQKIVFDTSPTLVTPVIGVATGTSLDLGATTLYASRAITVDTGGVLNIDLGSAAGDDFTVDTSKLVVEGDTGNVGIGIVAPLTPLDIAATTGVISRLTSTSTAVTLGDTLGEYQFYSSDTSTNCTGVAASITAIASGPYSSNNGGTDLVFNTRDNASGSANAAEKMRLYKSGILRVGTDSSSPTVKFEIFDSTSATDSITMTYKTFITSTGDMTDGFGAGVAFGIADATAGVASIASMAGVRDGSDTRGAFIFRTRGSGEAAGGLEKMRIDNAGLIWIGGNIALDTNFSRSAANMLYTPDSWTIAGDASVFGAFTITEAKNITLGTTTGTKIGTATTQKLGFYNQTPTTQPTALTAANASALNTGDATSDTVIENMRTRIGELETKLKALGLLA